MPDRRTFLITCGGVVAAPALAQFGLPATGGTTTWRGTPSGGLPACSPPTPLTLTLKIAGWEPQTDCASDVRVHINSSWRATWR